MKIRPTLDPSISYKSSFKPIFATLDSIIPVPVLRFLNTATAKVLGSELVQLLSELHNYTEFMESCALNIVQPTNEEMRLVYATQIYIEYQLLSLPFEKADYPLMPLQECVRLSLYVSTQPLYFVSSPSAAFIRTMASQLKESLERVEEFATGVSCREVILWVLLVIAQISKGEKLWTWCVAQISSVAESLGLSTAEQVKGVLRGFCYIREPFSVTIVQIIGAINGD
jgi:hypothetical protein